NVLVIPAWEAKNTNLALSLVLGNECLLQTLGVLCNELRCRVQDLFGATVGGIEVDLSGVGELLKIHHALIALCEPESIDRLVIITNNGDSRSGVDMGCDPPVLDCIGVLEFISKHEID